MNGMYRTILNLQRVIVAATEIRCGKEISCKRAINSAVGEQHSTRLVR